MVKSSQKINIPKGIKFSDKVAIIPSVLDVFSHTGQMKSIYENTYTWINRGDPLGFYSINVDRINIPVLKLLFGTYEKSVSIPSPVSGLLLHSRYGFGAGSDEYITAILLPVDGIISPSVHETDEETGYYMFSELCRLCSEQKAYFLKPSRYWSMAAWTEDDLQNRIGEQLSKKYKIVNALPTYKAYIEEIRSRYPELRPFIEHLVN